MVKLNKLLTIFCASSLYSVVAGYQDTFEGECLDLYNTLGEKYSIDSCEIDENGKLTNLNISSNEEVLTQSDIDVLSSFSQLQELKLVRFNDIADIHLESLYIPKLIFYDLKYSTHSKVNRFRDHTFPIEVLRTIKNVDALELDGFQITQNTLNTLTTLTNLKEIHLLDSGYDENLDFSVLKNAKSLTTLSIGHYYKAQSLDGFPESICQIKQLKKLNFFSETSTIPKCINNLKKLEYLDFDENELTELPDEIGGLSKLKYLNLDYNSVSSFNSALCKLTKLETLKISYNEITEIPSCIEKLSKLKILILCGNNFESLPSSFYNLKKLENLDLGGNQISKLSSNIKNFKNLKYLDLYRNNIATLPDNFGKLVNLETLILNINKISKLPKSIGNLVNVKNINLSENSISELPETIGNLKNIVNLDLSKNAITGIPETIGNLKNIVNLNLCHNKISEIPKSMGKLTKLENLDLNNNSITDLPECLGNLTSLQYLDLSVNKIDAVIPESYNNLEKLQTIKLDANVDIRGKTLTNENLQFCSYNLEENKTTHGICITENAKCEPWVRGDFLYEYYNFPRC